MKYSLVGNSVTLFFDKKTVDGKKIIHLPSGDLRYKEIYPLVNKGLLTEEKALKILNFETVLDKDVCVKDGKFFLGKNEIEIRDDLILAAQENFKELKSLVYTIENHEAYDKKKTVEVFLENKDKILPFSKDGMRFLIFEASDVNLKNTPFYYCPRPDVYFKKISDKYKDYKKMLKEVFSLGGKKFFGVFEIYFFDEKNKRVNLDLMNFLRATKGYFDVNKIQELIQVESLYAGMNVQDSKRLKEFLDFYFPTNQKKAFNLLMKNKKFPEDMLFHFSGLKREGVLNPDRNFTSLIKMAREYKRNYFALKDKFETDIILKKFPILETIDGESIGEYKLTFPKSAREVVLWGEEMNNCFGGRASSFLEGRNLLMGLINEQDKVEFVFEVVSKRFGDFEGRIGSNTALERKEKFNGDVMSSRRSRAKEVKPMVAKFLKKHGVLK